MVAKLVHATSGWWWIHPTKMVGSNPLHQHRLWIGPFADKELAILDVIKSGFHWEPNDFMLDTSSSEIEKIDSFFKPVRTVVEKEHPLTSAVLERLK